MKPDSNLEGLDLALHRHFPPARHSAVRDTHLPASTPPQPVPAPAASAQWVQAVNTRNAAATHRGDCIAAAVVAVVAGIALAAALLHWLTPCDTQAAGPALCAALITPTRQPWLLRWLRGLGRSVMRLHLRWQLADLDQTLDRVNTDLADLPEVRNTLRIQRDALTVELAGLELAQRES